MSMASPDDHGVGVQRQWDVRSRVDCLAAGLTLERTARELGWDETEAATLNILMLELATNAVRHAGGGVARIVIDTGRCDIVVEDEGPGLTPAVLADQGRTDRFGQLGQYQKGVRPPQGLGSGLAGVRRLADELRVENRPERGARAWACYRRKTGRGEQR